MRRFIGVPLDGVVTVSRSLCPYVGGDKNSNAGWTVGLSSMHDAWKSPWELPFAWLSQLRDFEQGRAHAATRRCVSSSLDSGWSSEETPTIESVVGMARVATEES